MTLLEWKAPGTAAWEPANRQVFSGTPALVSFIRNGGTGLAPGEFRANCIITPLTEGSHTQRRYGVAIA